MQSKKTGRVPNWGNITTTRPRIPLQIDAKMSHIRQLVEDPNRAEKYILELLNQDVSLLSVKLFDGCVSASPNVIAFGGAIGNSIGYEKKTVPSSLLRKPSDTFLIRVSGDSMSDAGILDGSIVAVESFSGEPSNGSIVVASIDDRVVIKEYQYRYGRHEFLSKNKAKNYPPIIVSPEMLEQYSVSILGLFDLVIHDELLAYQ